MPDVKRSPGTPPVSHRLPARPAVAPESDAPSLKRARWRGRVPDALADIAEENAGLLTRDQVVTFYEKRRPYINFESRQLLLPPVAVAAACQRLNLAAPVQGTVQLYSGEATGLIVQLPGWEYPAVIDTLTGTVRYDNYGGAWKA